MKTKKDLFIKRVNELMKKNKWSQKQLANESGISESSISRYIAGDMTPRMDIVMNIAKAFGVTTSYLLGEEHINLAKNSFNETISIVARNKSKLTDDQKAQIIKTLFGN